MKVKWKTPNSIQMNLLSNQITFTVKDFIYETTLESSLSPASALSVHND
jgi:hypothetical protein